MIGFLRGTLVASQPPRLVLDVNGVGYELEAPMSTCLELPPLGADLQLVTHLQVREDQHTLYAFATEAERQLFRDLLKVNRVGARLALAILSGMSVDVFSHCVRQEDAATLAKIPGVGRKTAERLIMDMRDRIDAELSIVSVTRVAGSTPVEPRHEAFNALTGLGYKPAEARKMLENASAELTTTEDILRSVLQSAAPAGP